MINVLVVPIIDSLEKAFEVVVVPTSHLLLEGLNISGKLELLWEETRQEPLDVVGQQLIRVDLVGLPLRGNGSQHLIVAWKNNLEEAKSQKNWNLLCEMEAAFEGAVEELHKMLALHEVGLARIILSMKRYF